MKTSGCAGALRLHRMITESLCGSGHKKERAHPFVMMSIHKKDPPKHLQIPHHISCATALFLAVLVVGNCFAQAPQIPAGLIDTQAAAVVIGQKNYSDITFGSDDAEIPLEDESFPLDRRWGSISSIAVAGNRFFVVDSSYLSPQDNNRVLIYNDLAALKARLPQDDLIPADVFLGQPDPEMTEPGTSATQMFQPSGVATDGTRLFVSEWGNNRVLIYNQIPTTTGAAADIVVGQQSFDTSGFSAGPAAMSRPNSVATDGQRLFVADTLNNRVLIYNQIPTANGASADVVLGQPDFDASTHGAVAANRMFDPMSVTTDGQRLIVSDLANNRILIYNQIPTTNGAPADVVLGQPDFTSNSPGVTATSLNFPRYAFSDGTRLVVVDSGNNRILIYNQIPTANGAAPDIVLGQLNFEGLLESCASSHFAVPVSAATDGEMLFISDAFNRRVLGFRPGAPLVDIVVNGASFSDDAQTAACDVVIPQPPIGPGGIATIFGHDLAETTEQATDLPLPNEMGGVKVLVNGLEAPLYYVSPTQINFQVPFTLDGFSASLVVVKETSSGTVVSTAAPVGVADGAPGIFTWDGTPTGLGVITDQNFDPITEANPARPGDTLVAFVTGLGSVDQPTVDGAGAQFGAEGKVTVSGPVVAGQSLTISINDVPYSYTTVEDDSVSNIVFGLAETIDRNDPLVSAFPNVIDLGIQLRAREFGDQGANIRVSTSASAGSNLTATVEGADLIPGSILFFGEPEPGQVIRVRLQETNILYTVAADDTTETVIVKLAEIVGGDPNVAAEADLPDRALHLSLKPVDLPEGEEDMRSITFDASVTDAGVRMSALTGSSSTVPGSIEIVGDPAAGQTVTVFLITTAYSYTTVEGDSLENIVTQLASRISQDPNVGATASGSTVSLTRSDDTLNIRFSVDISVANALVVDSGGAGAVPATLTLTGIPKTGQDLRVVLGPVIRAYRVPEGDTLEDVVSALAAALDFDPNVAAVADPGNRTVELTLVDEEVPVSFSVSVSRADSFSLATSRQRLVPGTADVTNRVSGFIGEPLALVPGDVFFSGTVRVGETIIIRLLDTVYAYTITSGDTIETLITRLAEQVDADPNVSATADTTILRVQLALRDPGAVPAPQITFASDVPFGSPTFVRVQSNQTSGAGGALVSFAGLVKGGVGLYQINFQLPEATEPNPETKLTFSQNLIIFGSVSVFDIFSNTVTFPVVAAE